MLKKTMMPCRLQLRRACGHHAQQLQRNAQLQPTGNLKFSGGLGSTVCQMTAQLPAIPGSSTANFPVQPGGFLVACQTHQVEATGLPWVVHNETQRLEITTGDIHLGLTGGFCPAQSGTVTPVNAAKGHTVTATPNQPKTVSSFILSGTVEVHLYNAPSQTPFRSETATTSGTLSILAPNAATYSLE